MTMEKSDKILVLGSTGMVGSAFVRELTKRCDKHHELRVQTKSIST